MSAKPDAPAFVADHATRRDVLPLDQAALIGVAGPEGAMRALIRLADGKILSAGLGERIALGRLTEISPAGVVIEHDSGFAGFLRPYPWGKDIGAG